MKQKQKFDREILEFFEYEKNDSLEEFIINYQNYKYSDKQILNKQLTSLYRKLLMKEINNLKLKEKDEDINNLLRNQTKEKINAIKKILAYLKKQKNREIVNPIICNKVNKKKKKVKKTNENNHFEEYETSIENLEDYKFIKALSIFNGNIIDKKIDVNLLKQSKYILNEYIYKEDLIKENKEYIIYLFRIHDSIKNRLKKVDKDRKYERKILKEIDNLFKYITDKYKQELIKKEDPYFDIVNYFLNEEDYFMYLKSILEEFNEMINCRYVTNNEDKPLLLYVLDKYIENYKKIIENKNNDFINQNYLKIIYMYIFNNYKLKLSKNEIKLIDIKLKKFMEYVNANITSSKRKEIVKNDIKNMYSNNMYIKEKEKVIEEYDDYRLENQLNAIRSNLISSINSSRRKNIMDEYTFLLNTDYAAFSIDIENNILKINVIDIYDCMYSITLDKYLSNMNLKNEYDAFLDSSFKMYVNEKYPTITYEIKLDDKDYLKIYKSSIKINTRYTEYDYLYNKKDENISYLNKNIKNIDYVKKIEEELNKRVVSYFSTNNLPFIYSGKCNLEEKEKLNILNMLSSSLGKIDKKIANKIYDIIINKEDEFHYDVYPFNGEYTLNIMNPVNYIGLIIQRIITDIILEDRNNEIEKGRVISKYRDIINDVVLKYNYYNNYVNKDELKRNKGKLKYKKLI